MRVRRLPGFRFEAQPSAPPEILPRMDIAALVGFAASGPLNVPVAVEDAAQFSAIFGADAPLAFDAERGETTYAHLAPAVRAFFRNGGRRCWVIRVADAETAQVNQFPVAGMLRAPIVDGQPRAPVPAFASARSAGSGSDDLRVSASLTARSLREVELETAPLALVVRVADGIGVGDLLRLSWAANTLFFAVTSLETTGFSPPQPDAVRLRGMSVWFEQPAPASPPDMPNTARIYTTSADGVDVVPAGALLIDDAGGASIDLHLALAAAPAPGSWVRLDFGADSFWLMADSARSETGSSLLSPPDAVTSISGRGMWWRASAPDISTLGVPDVEVLTCALGSRSGEEWMRLDDLGLAPGHARFWGDLPSDEQLYSADSPPALWISARDPRFPLAGDPAGIMLPLLLSGVPRFELGRVATPETALERDGLADFNAHLFLDDALEALSLAEIMTKADFVRYLGANPRPLTGIHAALALEEVTLIAVPDAVHTGWRRFDPPPPDAPEPLLPIARPEWWHHLDCDPPMPVPRTPQPAWGNFLDCAIELIDAPELTATAPDTAGTFTLTWESDIPDGVYVLEEAALPDFADAQSIYAGKAQTLTLYGRAPGAYYYHVRVQAGANTSDWSDGTVVEVATGSAWRVLAPNASAIRTLIDVQRSLLRMCAARGDIFALLSLPAHYREEDAIAHPATLGPTAPVDLLAITPTLGYGEANALSYGAIYHPWLVMSEDDAPEQLRTVPPEGSICGMVARRTLNRGAWIAPANDPLRGVIALTPPIAPDYWLDLQDAGVNLVRSEPYGTVTLNADTLSTDDSLQLINVRRLLMLLRRVAQRLGARYVFEPFDGTFRRIVQRAFEARLEFMFSRGAFAGATPATAFQVSIVSTPLDVDNGRFIVELRVAPSLPMRFVTIRLVQSGDRSSITEEV